jgi:hypothetical protein
MLDASTLRHRITRIIAATRFPFVDQESWGRDHQTIVNDEVKRYAINTPYGVLYPSIIITNDDGSLREIGVVESAEDISEDSISRWKALSDVAPYGREFKKLFLYVPEGYEAKTLKYFEDEGINFDGIRGYRVENQVLKILPFKTLNDEYDDVVT